MTTADQQAPAGELTHFDATGQAHMVDVGSKDDTRRSAVAAGTIRMQSATLALIMSGNAKRRRAGHRPHRRHHGRQAHQRPDPPVPPAGAHARDGRFRSDAAANSVHCRAQVDTTGKTGVEMEALTSVQIGLLTIYDMCKAVDRGMVMTNVRVLESTAATGRLARGGISGCRSRWPRCLDAAQVAQQPHGAGQAQRDDGHGQGQVELFQPCQREAGVDGARARAQRGAHCRKEGRPPGVQQHVPVAHQHDGNGRQVEHEETPGCRPAHETFPIHASRLHRPDAGSGTTWSRSSCAPSHLDSSILTQL
jgi:cyclic pyranopterin phosphate synthase